LLLCSDLSDNSDWPRYIVVEQLASNANAAQIAALQAQAEMSKFTPYNPSDYS
jgi:hypothetical protein